MEFLWPDTGGRDHPVPLCGECRLPTGSAAPQGERDLDPGPRSGRRFEDTLTEPDLVSPDPLRWVIWNSPTGVMVFDRDS
ncbi:hypothetical protein ACWEBX_35340, partial [Streptomyces sp. NPDC005070]